MCRLVAVKRKRAGDGTRTHDSHLGKVALCQLSYTRTPQQNPWHRQWTNASLKLAGAGMSEL